ncbi:hypothetical protein DLM78_08125 [Leptospira stimsonii]|uniref:Uncharacterized protein n=1 Tax=Leptospira stimsonii TaxID=2202203 RepID=A0A8B3D162_9LEPT|nr:hypothetical protein DLM78_08125 [Leptospira stimsonii]
MRKESNSEKERSFPDSPSKRSLPELCKSRNSYFSLAGGNGVTRKREKKRSGDSYFQVLKKKSYLLTKLGPVKSGKSGRNSGQFPFLEQILPKNAPKRRNSHKHPSSVKSTSVS